MTIDKPFYYEDRFTKPRVKKVSRKVSNIISERLDRTSMADGGPVEVPPKPKPGNVVPLIP